MNNNFKTIVSHSELDLRFAKALSAETREAMGIDLDAIEKSVNLSKGGKNGDIVEKEEEAEEVSKESKDDDKPEPKDDDKK